MSFSHSAGFLPTDQANRFFQTLKEEIAWYPFVLSPNSRPVHHWNPKGDGPTVYSIIDYVIDRLKREYGVSQCEGVFMNLYRDGTDHCPYHSDKYGCDTYTLSLGDTRDFLLKPKATGTNSQSFALGNGDLYYMAKELHTTHRHSVPKRVGSLEPRISLLFIVTHKPTYPQSSVPPVSPMTVESPPALKIKGRIKPPVVADDDDDVADEPVAPVKIKAKLKTPTA
jgi:hypothetical protein